MIDMKQCMKSRFTFPFWVLYISGELLQREKWTHLIKKKKEKIMDIETAIEAIREEWDENGDVYTEEELREFALENLRDMD